MAKDTEKLIRQLSLISYLMAERRPVTALEIRRDVEGYSTMNEDAFARRFYADRAELESLGIELRVDKPVDGAAEQENYTLPAENFHLPAVAFTDGELAALQTALHELDGKFAYAEPLRLALQQIAWGRPNPLRAPEHSSVRLAVHASADGHELSQRLAKIETAIFRRKTITFGYYTLGRDVQEERRVDPYQLLYRGGQFYLVAHSHERGEVREFRLSRIRGKVAYATKAEHDFSKPVDFDPRVYANRSEWQLGRHAATAEILLSERIAWYVERNFGQYGELAAPDPAEHAGAAPGDRVFRTGYSDSRALVAWLLALGEHARVLGPAELGDEVAERAALVVERHTGAPVVAPAATPNGSAGRRAAEGAGTAGGRGATNGRAVAGEAGIRPERFARLVTLASILIEAGRAGRRIPVGDLIERTGGTEQELREDLGVLNVVNFGGGTYMLYAEVTDDGEVEVDPEPYADTFARPARLLPVEAKALVAAIDFIGEHIPAGSLSSAREKIVRALGHDPAGEGLQIVSAAGDDSEIAEIVSRAITAGRVLEIDYYKENEDEFSTRRVEPHLVFNGHEGWYVKSFDRERGAVRTFRLDRIRRATVTDEPFTPRGGVDLGADLETWPRTGEVRGSERARVWISAERERWERERRTVVEELQDGSVVVDLPFAGTDYLVREVLRAAGDAAVLEPPAAREAVREAAARLVR